MGLLAWQCEICGGMNAIINTICKKCGKTKKSNKHF